MADLLSLLLVLMLFSLPGVVLASLVSIGTRALNRRHQLGPAQSLLTWLAAGAIAAVAGAASGALLFLAAVDDPGALTVLPLIGGAAALASTVTVAGFKALSRRHERSAAHLTSASS